ncbi:MAG: FAD:protein FMN transferase [Microthrixaceae bacterium]
MPRLASDRDQVEEWSAMGTTCRAWLVGVGAQGTAGAARRTVTNLEARWSRFVPSSDVSRLNAAEGEPTVVARETLEVIEQAIAWSHATDGRFDPTVLDALCSAGYDRDRATGHGPIRPGVPAPGCAGIVLDAAAGTAQLPPGVRIDLGGIGKGRAVDIVTDSLQDVAGGLIDLGGDLRVWGRAPTDDAWPIAIEDLRDGTTAALLGLAEGAVATSSTLRRHWRDGERRAHHLIDPRTGRPVAGDLVSVTVVAGSAAAAEVLAKAAVVAGSASGARRLLADHDVPGLLVARSGPPIPVGELDELFWARSDEGG